MVQDALNNIFSQIDMFQSILLDVTKINRLTNQHVISIEMVNLKINIKINTVKLKPILTYNIEFEDAKHFLYMLLEKYHMRVEGITYIYQVANKELKIEVYNKNGQQVYSLSTIRRGLELLVSYKIFKEKINYDELLDDWNDLIQLVNHYPPNLKIILANPSILSLVRKKKLRSVGIF